MKALCWQGKKDIRCEEVPEPIIEDPRDVILKVTSCAICGSDLHLMDGFIPSMCKGDVLGHEFMGEIVEVGSSTTELKVGDRVVVPFQITCGECEQCRKGNFSVCQRSNRNADLAAALYGQPTAGLFGYSNLTGGYAGGQAEFVRVPFADTTAIKVPSTMSDDQALFIGDILTTGWQAADQADIQPEDTVAVWGAGPVGQFAIKSALIQGAAKVIVIDRLPERLAMARQPGVETINFDEQNVLEALKEMTGGKGPDKCIDCVGLEAHVQQNPVSMMDKIMTGLKLETDRPQALREAMMACKPGGTISIAGVYGGLLNMLPFGAAFQKGLTFRMGQTHVRKYAFDLLRRIDEGQIDPSFVITHRGKLTDGWEWYNKFRNKEDGCIKVVLTPN